MNIDALLEKLSRSLERLGLRDSGLVVGVSGGPDSIALLLFMVRLGVQPLVVAHLNRGFLRVGKIIRRKRRTDLLVVAEELLVAVAQFSGRRPGCEGKSAEQSKGELFHTSLVA